MKVLSLLLVGISLLLSLLFGIMLSDSENALSVSYLFLCCQAFSCFLIITHNNGSIDFRDIRLIAVLVLFLYSSFYPLVVLLEFIRGRVFLIETVYLFGLSFTGLYFAFFTTSAKTKFINLNYHRINYGLNPVVLNTIFFIAFIFLLIQRGIPMFSATSSLSRTEIFETHSQLWVVLMFMINASSIFTIVVFNKISLTSKVIFVFTTFLFIFIHYNMGNRRDYLPIILAFICMYLIKRKVKFNLKFMILGVMLFLFSFWVSINRNSNNMDLSEQKKLELAISSNEFVYPMQTLIFTIRDGWDFRYGETYFLLPIQILIPRSLYKNKPRGLGSELVLKTNGGGQGYAYTPTTEAYLNFGYFGPPLIFFIFGRVMSKLVIDISKSKNIVFYVVFYSLVFDFMRGDFSSFIYQSIIMYFIIKIIMLKIKPN